MIVNVFNEQSSLQLSIEQVQKLVECVILENNRTCDAVNIYFVDTPTICDLHDQFFNDPSPTDCISFPLDDGDEIAFENILGEVFVCPDTAIAYALENNLNCYEEVSLYIVHGLLHLMGYDDVDEESLLEMRKAEAHHIECLRQRHLILIRV